MNRRKLLKSLLALLGSATFVSIAYPLVRFLAPPAGESKTQKVTIKKDEIPFGGAKDIIVGSMPAIVINRPDKGFIAFSKVCTHLGCLVGYEKDKKRILCPCHAGTFDLEGNVTGGPPPKPLTKLPIKVEGENIVIG